MTAPTAIDLFCGAGGLSFGLTRAGFDILGAFDAWEPAVRSYRANFPNHPAWLEDVASLSRDRLCRFGVPEEVDLVAGGPPCQGFSIQRIGEDKDTRNDLVLAFGRVVVAIRAKTFLMENVPGLLGARGKVLTRRFLKEMNSAGYTVCSAVLDAATFGVPQTRRRVFFVGWRREMAAGFVFTGNDDEHKPRLTVRQAIGNLPSPPEDFSALLGDPLHRRMRLSQTNLQRLAHIPPGGGFEDLPLELRVECHKGGADRIGHRAVYGRLHPNRPAATITARFDSFTRGRFGHPWENRNITLREGARLQGFADTHVFLGTQEEIAAQIGNAVPPPLAAAVTGMVLRQLIRSGTADGAAPQGELPFFRENTTVAAA